uniref:Uncharacterized protein n=1 Tax=Lates calcarifer TaxID=8187 RepID=A0A4W6DMN0_LATCA
MKKSFECNESMIITIPIGNLREAGAGQLMPEKFHCVFKDSYKVFANKGKPKPLGVSRSWVWYQFVVTGLLSYAAGKAPNMCVAKLSFSLNIISFFWSVAAFSMSLLSEILLVVENLIALFLIYWLSKAICRQQFNTLVSYFLCSYILYTVR